MNGGDVPWYRSEVVLIDLRWNARNVRPCRIQTRPQHLRIGLYQNRRVVSRLDNGRIDGAEVTRPVWERLERQRPEASRIVVRYVDAVHDDDEVAVDGEAA